MRVEIGLKWVEKKVEVAGQDGVEVSWSDGCWLNQQKDKEFYTKYIQVCSVRLLCMWILSIASFSYLILYIVKITKTFETE